MATTHPKQPGESEEAYRKRAAEAAALTLKMLEGVERPGTNNDALVSVADDATFGPVEEDEEA